MIVKELIDFLLLFPPDLPLVNENGNEVVEVAAKQFTDEDGVKRHWVMIE